LKRLFKPVASTAYERLVREFYTHLRIDGDQSDTLFSSIDGREVEVTIGDIAAVLKCSHAPPESDIPWIECPSMLTLEDIVSDMCEGQYADDRQNAASKTKIPRNLFFIDMVLYRNVCPLGHKTQRRDLFLSAFYSFHRGFWCSIPKIIWRQIQKFCEGVHHRGAEHTKTWGLPFSFLITHILRKMGIKGTLADGPITESPYFGPIQWRQSLSHMPRDAPQPQPQPAPVPEPMDIPEMVAEHEMAFKPHREAEQEEQPEEYEEEYEEGVYHAQTLRSITLPRHPRGHTVPDQGRTIIVCRFSEGRSSGQTRGPGDVPSHHGQTASSSRTFGSTTSPVTSL
jgi:hypothetical protein